jgi:hypothetical protein
LQRYQVEMPPIGYIKPSPENDAVYGEIEHDEQMENLIESIRRKGLEEPLILTEDLFVLSGHRRLYALEHLGWDMVPVRIRKGICRHGNHEYHRDLVEYNPQRIKHAGSLLKEALLRDTDGIPSRPSAWTTPAYRGFRREKHAESDNRKGVQTVLCPL